MSNTEKIIKKIDKRIKEWGQLKLHMLNKDHPAIATRELNMCKNLLTNIDNVDVTDLQNPIIMEAYNDNAE